MINTQWFELPMSITRFNSSKDVRAIEVRLCLHLLIKVGVTHYITSLKLILIISEGYIIYNSQYEVFPIERYRAARQV